MGDERDLGKKNFPKDVHTLWEILGLVLGAHLGEVLSFSNKFCTFAFSVAAALRFIAATSQHQSVWSHFWGSNSYLYSAKLSCDDRPWRPSEKTPWNEDAPYENGLFYALPSLRSMYCFVFLFVLNWVSTCVKCDSWFAAIHTQVQERPTTVSHGHRIVNYNVRVSPENFSRIVHQTSSVSAKNDCYRKQTRRACMHPCIPSHPIPSHPIPSHPILFIFNMISFQVVAVVISSRSIHPWSMTLFHQNFQWSRAHCFTFNGLARMPTLMETQAGTPVGPGSEVNKNHRTIWGLIKHNDLVICKRLPWKTRCVLQIWIYVYIFMFQVPGLDRYF